MFPVKSCFCFLCLAAVIGWPATFALQSNDSPSAAASLPSTPTTGKIPDATSSDAVEQADAESIPSMPKFELPAELEPEAEAARASFQAARNKLENAIFEMRAVQTRFVNGEDKSPTVKEVYRQHRNDARAAMNETYQAAIELLIYMPDEAAAQYIATVVQHRAEQSIYDFSTYEGSARLIDAGARFRFLFQAGARSAVVSGEFDVARRLYEALDQEAFDKVDMRLFYSIDELETQFIREAEFREKEEQEDRLPRVKLETTRGDVVVELFLDSAPSTVANYINLVEQHYYDGFEFVQVVDNTLAFAGDPAGDAGTGRYLVDEHSLPNARDAFRGSLVMAKLPKDKNGNFYPNTASSHFAIMMLPQPRVRDQQTVFGRVVEGMDVISSLRRVDPSEKKEKKVLLPPDRILKAEMIRRPKDLPEPQYAEASAAIHDHGHDHNHAEH